MTVETLPRTNGKRRPVVIPVSRSELVGRFMDISALASEAIDANGASLELVLRLPAGPWRQELQMAHIATHDRLVKVIAELRMANGRYDKPSAA